VGRKGYEHLWSEPRERRDGDDFTYTWADYRVAIQLTNVHTGREGRVYADLEVCVLTGGENGHGPKAALLESARVDLADLRDREQLERKLRFRTEDQPLLDWDRALLHAMWTTKKSFKQGSEILVLADVPFTPDLEWAFTEIAPKGDATILYGDGQSGKSLTAMTFALAHVTGQTMAGGVIRPAKRGRALYLDWETDPAKHARRLQRLTAGLHLDIAPKTLFYQRWHGRLAEEARALRHAIDRYEIDLLILDSMFNACGNTLDTEAVSQFFGVLLSLPTWVSKLIIAHISAEGARTTKAAAWPAGLRQIWNQGRSNWELRADPVGEDQVDVALYHRKVNEGALRARPFGVRYRFDPVGGEITTGQFDVLGNQLLAAKSGPSDHVLAVLREGGATAPQIAEETGLSPDLVRATLSRLKRNGFAEKDADGVWRLVS